MLADDNDDISEIKQRCVCAGCVGEKYLGQQIRTRGGKARCSYCARRRKAMPIDDFADYIEHAFQHHYVLTSEDNYPNEAREGESVEFLIQNAAGVDEPIAKDVRMVLEERGPTGKDGLAEENPFSEEAHYRRREPRSGGVFADLWARFRKSVESETRMFNSEAENILNAIFEGLEHYAAWHGKKVVVCAGPDCAINALYRARAFQSKEKLKAAVAHPDRELGPPPGENAVAGRMNSRGIGVFYGATHESVALAETRPPVGSRVLVGRFEITRHLWLLDVGAMRAMKALGSDFQESYVEEQERTAFLSTLSNFMARPVMPEDETSEYLATQAIADYLATRDNPALDGIIYPSVQQSGKNNRNVVLFNKAARVRDLGLPRHTQFDAYIHDRDGEDVYEDYSVHVRKPPEKDKEKQAQPAPIFGFDDGWDPYPDPSRDERLPSLRIDLSSIKVRRIEGVSFRSADRPVTRRESEMTEDELKKLQAEALEDF